MKRIISFVMVMSVCLGMINCVSVSAAANGCDIVFAIDDSVSMKTNDAKKVVSSAISEAFVDAKEEDGIRIGAVTYGLEIVNTFPIADFKAQTKVDFDLFLKTKLTQQAEGSDYAIGLTEADKLLGSADTNKAVVLITSGDNDYKTSGRDADKTDSDVKEIQKKGYPVYVVGLKPGEETKKNLEKVATMGTASAQGAKNTKAPAAEKNIAAQFPATDAELKAAIKSVVEEICKNSAAALATPDPKSTQEPLAVDGDKAEATAAPAVKNTDTENTFTKTIASGQETSIEIEVYNLAKNGKIRINHTGMLDIKLVTPSGLPLEFGTGSATLSRGEGYSEVYLSEPVQGKWIMNITDNLAEKIKITPEFEYKLKISFLNTTNVVYTGISTIYRVQVQAEEGLNIDTKNLEVRLFIKDGNEADYKQMVYANGHYECTYACKATGNKQIYAVVLMDEGSIKSDPMNVMVVDNPSEEEGSSIWGILILAAFLLLIVTGYIIKYRKQISTATSLRRMTGAVSIEVKQNTVQPIVYQELRQFGKKRSLYEIVQNRALLEIQEVVIQGVKDGIKVINTGTARVRFTHVSSDPEGVVVRYGQGFKVFLSDHRTEIMVRYIEEVPESNSDEATEEETSRF